MNNIQSDYYVHPSKRSLLRNAFRPASRVFHPSRCGIPRNIDSSVGPKVLSALKALSALVGIENCSLRWVDQQYNIQVT